MNSFHSEQKETKTALVICIVLSIFAVLTLILGLVLKNPYWVIAGIVPAAIYETWRTEGWYTKTASIAILILVFLEILAILDKIKINLSQTLQSEQAYLAGYYIPLGDILFIFPIVVVILSILLIWRTYGQYTKWLAALLLANSIALLYLVNKSALLDILRQYF